jgi:GT2 family glycosyltransferase
MKTMKNIHVLIPTYKRAKALAVTLTSLYFQSERSFDIVISDQSPDNALDEDQTFQTVIRLLRNKGHNVKVLKNLPSKGMAQQRQFLLDQSTSKYSLFLDDDLVLESYVLKNMKETLESNSIGFVGCAVIGLSYQDDVRPHQQQIEFWQGEVEPETIIPKSEEWERYKVHNAANIYHIEQKFNVDPAKPMPYKIAWVGGCVMYDTKILREVGGFSFWKELPEKHCGEDVLAQLRVMKKYGGCGIIPSGVYHQELETTVPDRKVNAPEFLQI